MEIAKSRTLKVQLGEYQSLDLFCSAKVETTEENAEKDAQRLADFCRTQVIKDKDKELKFWAEQVTKEAKDKILNLEI